MQIILLNASCSCWFSVIEVELEADNALCDILVINPLIIIMSQFVSYCDGKFEKFAAYAKVQGQRR